MCALFIYVCIGVYVGVYVGGMYVCMYVYMFVYRSILLRRSILLGIGVCSAAYCGGV